MLIALLIQIKEINLKVFITESVSWKREHVRMNTAEEAR
jgi:hypothetical protein